MYGDFKKLHISYMAIFVTPTPLYVPPPQNKKKASNLVNLEVNFTI